MLKKYGKAIEQPQGPQIPEEPAGSVGRKVLRTSFPGRLPCQGNPCSPTPSGECGRWKGKATPESGGSRRGADRLEALSSQCALSSPAPGREAWLPPEKLKPHSHLLHETSAPRLPAVVPLLASGMAPGLRRPRSKAERQGQLAASHKEGYGQWDFRNKFNFGFSDIFKPSK